ncbi:MAG: VCBS repeat-containing protein [Planctomycetaceae bacterium]|nr:VCBS repeat-containing protein [Planctomycetaceae bacterium]
MLRFLFPSRRRTIGRFDWLTSARVERLEDKTLLAGTVLDAGRQLVVANNATDIVAPAIPIYVDGTLADTENQIVIYHLNRAGDYRQKLVVDSNGFLRARHTDSDAEAGMEDPFGTSLKLGPGLILNNGSGPEHYLSARLTEINIVQQGQGNPLKIIAKGSPMNGSGDVLDSVEVTWEIFFGLNFSGDTQEMRIRTLFTATKTLTLDSTALTNAEAFRVAEFSSSNVSPARTTLGVRTRDADQLVAQNANGNVELNLNKQAVNALFFSNGLANTSTVALNQVVPAPLNQDPPSILASVYNPGVVKFRVQGYISDDAGINENSDNLGAWISRDFASSTISAGQFMAWTVDYTIADTPHLTAKDDFAYWDAAASELNFGRSSGNLLSHSIIPYSDANPWSFYSGDFDGDGDSEIAGRIATGTWWVRGIAAFSGAEKSFGSWASDAAAGWTNVQVIDVNGDGRDDILGQHQLGHWWAAISTGTTFVNTYMGRWANSGWVTLKAGDYNGDGKVDMAGLRENGVWIVGLNDGGRFRDFHYGRWNGSAGWHSFNIVDFNGDGRDDILAQTASNTWWIGSIQGPGNSFGTSYAGRSQGNESFVADFNDDGIEDIAERNSNGVWWVSQNDGSGKLVNPSIWGRSDIGETWSFISGDFDGNNVPDLLAFRHSDREWFLLASASDKFIASPILSTSPFDPAAEYLVGDFYNF